MMLEFRSNTVRHAGLRTKFILYTQGTFWDSHASYWKSTNEFFIYLAELENPFSAHMTNPSAITEFFSTTVMPDRMWKPSDALSASCTPCKELNSKPHVQ